MIEEYDLLFTREGICHTIEELKIISEKSGIIKTDEISVDIRTGTDMNARIKPFEYKEELHPLQDWKGKLNTIKVVFPLNSQKMDELYNHKRNISSMYDDSVGLRFSSISKNPDSWDYYHIELNSSPLCENQRIGNIIKNIETYDSKECVRCPSQIKEYCKDLTSILKTYSLPKKIQFEFTGGNH